MPDAPAPTVQRPRRPLWRRLLRWFCVLTFLMLLALSGAAWWIYNNQSVVVHHLLQRLPEPMKATVGEFTADQNGVTLSDLVLVDKTTQREWLRLPKAKWTPDWKQVATGHLGTLKAENAIVSLDAAQFASDATPSGAATPMRPIKLDKVDLKNIQVRFQGNAELPSATFTLDQTAENIDLTDLSRPQIGSFAMKLTSAALEDGALKLPDTEISGSLSREDGILHIDKATVQSTSLKPSQALVDRFKKLLQPAPTSQPSESPIKGINIKALDLDKITLDTNGIAGLPRASGTVDCELRDIDWKADQPLHLGAQTLSLDNVIIQPPTGDGHIKLQHLDISLAGMTPDGLLHVTSAVITRPEIEWKAGLEGWLMALSSGAAPPAAASTSNPPVKGVQIDSYSIADAALTLSRTPNVAFAAHTKLNFEGTELRVADGKMSSPKPQRLMLENTEVAEHPADKESALPPMVAFAKAGLDVVPDDWNKDLKLKDFSLVKPVLRFTPETTTLLAAKSPDSKPTPAATTPSEQPLWQRVLLDKITLTEGELEYSHQLGNRMDVKTRVAIRTEPFKSAEGTPYQTITLKNTRAMAPELTDAPVTNLDELTATIEWPKMWKTERVESLRLKGAEIDVNEALKRLLMPSPSTKPTEAPVAAAPLPADNGWRINRLTINDTGITLHKVLPGLPPIKFSLNYEAWDMPLQPRRLIGRLEPQKIELSELSLRSPFESLREVANLNTIFVHFTLDGVLAGRIDKVEVINPTLNVGEDLFWYVDYYRKYAAGELPADEPAPRIVSSDDNFAFEAAAQFETEPSAPSGWTVETLAVEGGKIVIAPKGVPLPGIPRPFPFKLITKLDKGHFEAELDIPTDTYTWEKLKLEFEDLRGHVIFNIPHKNVSNNLTETFRVKRIRYQQLHMEDAFLSVTYDANGIYGQFGGEAYEGYVKGAFNIYLDANFSWDGWITGTGVKTTEITQKLCPAYLLLDGKVDASVIALGNQNEVYQTDISFTNTSPGKFSITTLNSALESIPTDVEGYIQDITRIGIETVRDFDYDKAEAKARFYGREGRGFLKLSGPLGSRNIDINVFDHRWNAKKKSVTVTPNAAE